MIPERFLISQQVVDRIRKIPVAFLIGWTFITGSKAIFAVYIAIIIILIKIHAEIGTPLQSRDECYFKIGTIGNIVMCPRRLVIGIISQRVSPTPGCTVVSVVKNTIAVLVQSVGIRRTVPFINRIHCRHRTQKPYSLITGRPFAHAMRQTDVGSDLQPFVYIIVQVCPCWIAFETLDRKYTFIVQVTGWYKVVGFFILTTEVYRIFLTQTGFQQSVSPISPIIQLGIGIHLPICPDRHINVIRVITELTHHIIRRIGTGIFVPITWIQIAIIQSTPSQLR